MGEEMPLKTAQLMKSVTYDDIMGALNELGYIIFWPPQNIPLISRSETDIVKNIVSVFVQKDTVLITYIRDGKLYTTFFYGKIPSPTFIIEKGKILGKYTVPKPSRASLTRRELIYGGLRIVPTSKGYRIMVANDSVVKIATEVEKLGNHIEYLVSGAIVRDYLILKSAASVIKKPVAPNPKDIYLTLVRAKTIEEVVKKRPDVIAYLYLLETQKDELAKAAEIRGNRLFIYGHDVAELARIVHEDIVAGVIRYVIDSTSFRKKLMDLITKRVQLPHYLLKLIETAERVVHRRCVEDVRSGLDIDCIARTAVMEAINKLHDSMLQKVYKMLDIEDFDIHTNTVKLTIRGDPVKVAYATIYANKKGFCSAHGDTLVCKVEKVRDLFRLIRNTTTHLSKLISRAENDASARAELEEIVSAVLTIYKIPQEVVSDFAKIVVDALIAGNKSGTYVVNVPAETLMKFDIGADFIPWTGETKYYKIIDEILHQVKMFKQSVMKLIEANEHQVE